MEVECKILLVSDDTAEARLIKKILAQAPGIPVEIRVAGSLSSAIALVGTNSLDAILVDLALKDSAGSAILDALKVHAKGTSIIALGGSETENPAAAAKQLGVHDYLVKGQLEHSLVRVVRYAVERKRTAETLRESEERYRRLVEISTDAVTELKWLKPRLSYLAQYDVLTELPNRSQFRDRLDGAMARATRNKQLVGVMLLGLDHFQTVNATLGQEAGDLALKLMAERLKNFARKSDTVARVGGDEFSVILEGLTEKPGADVVAQRVLESLSRPLLLDGQQVRLTASLGLTVFPSDAHDLDALLRNADVAMYYAKERGRNNYQFYSPELDALTRREELRRAEIGQRLARLTRREREVLDLLVAGKANKMVAYLLGTSSRTIDNHRANIMDKMQADSLPELVRMKLSLSA